MQPRELDLNEVVRNLATMLSRVVREDVRIELALEPGRVPLVGDVGMIEQVLMNLAVNARDAMPAGGRLTIRSGVREVGPGDARALPGVEPGLYACLEVSDSGTGIAPEHLPHIFEPFFTTKEPGKGTGLGLATVFGIVRQHRGSVTVASTPGGGTTFQVLLPATGEVVVAPAQPSSVAAAGGGETVMVVEDDAAVRRLTVRLLERAGYRVMAAGSGGEALALWERHAAGIHLVLSDFVVPDGMNGRELARELRRRKPGVRVLLTSGYAEELARLDAGSLDVDGILDKPFRPDALLAAIRSALAIDRSAPDASA
ncbi:MAG: response regulator [Myxococcota bacterium]